jgi:type IV pilus assembly protein PilM
VFKKKRVNADGAVGLDLDPSHIAAAEVHVNGSITVTRGAVADLRPGILRDGEVVDPIALGDELRAFFAEHELPRRVRLGVANQRIVVRTLDLPPIDDEKGLAAAVRLEAPDHIPMPMDEAILDFQSLGVVNTSAGPRTRVVVAAARRDSLDRLIGAAHAAGLQLVGIDLSAFAMIRALKPSATGAALYVNASGLTNVAVADETGCLFTRAAAGGLSAIVATLAERRSLTLEHARMWLRHTGLQEDVEDIEGDPEVIAEARAILLESTRRLATEVRASLEFHQTQAAAAEIAHAVLTGAAASIPGFAAALSSELGMPVHTRSVEASDELAATTDLGGMTIAAGLAVEQVSA